MCPVIEVHHLSKSYGPVKALRDISFSIEKGSVVGLLGPNGAGKTSVIRTLVGLSDGDRGSIRICGQSVLENKGAIKALFGYMPEHNPLPEDMRVEEYLYYRSLLKKLPLKSIRKRIGEVMQLCDLDYKARQKPIRNLSKGYRQRVGIADTLLAQPPIIILDEPTIGLDPHQIISLRKLIESLKQEATLILSSHILKEIEVSCDRVIILNQGYIVAQGTPQALKEQFLKKSSCRLCSNGSVEGVKGYLGDAHLENLRCLSIDGSSVHLSFEVADTALFYRVFTEALRKHPQWELYAFTHLEPTLEDVFIAATEQHWQGLTQAPIAL